MTNDSPPPQYFDNTRLTAFMACPRSYFFRHVKHWGSTKKPLYFAFGSAWHSAMDVIWLGADKYNQDDLTDIAKFAFDKTWGEEAEEPEMPDLKEFRNPGLAHDMLINYITMRHVQIAAYKIIDVEKAFIVPIIEGSDLFYIGRIDKVFQDRASIYFAEHKTTTSYKADGGFRSDFLESFAPNNQIDGYIYQGKVTYGDKFKGINIDAALVHKNHHDFFKTIPISRLEQITEGWIWETQYWINEIVDNLQFYHNLVKSGDEPVFMPAFPKKTSSCMSYQGYTTCAYHSLCRFQSENPTFMECPDNFEVNEWKPFEILMGEEEEEDERKD